MSVTGESDSLYRRMDEMLLVKRPDERDYAEPAAEYTGETVQSENAAQKASSAKDTGTEISVPVNITISGMTVRENADVDRIAEELVRRIKRTSKLMPNL